MTSHLEKSNEIHERNVAALDRIMTELDEIYRTLDHAGAKDFCDWAIVHVRNVRAVESVLRWNPDDVEELFR